MQIFVYTARDLKTGAKVQAEVEAQTVAAAARLLTERGLAPLDIKSKEETGHRRFFKSHVPVKQKIIFSRQLATLINAGLPLVQSLENVRSQTNNKQLQEVVAAIISDVEAGTTLSGAMEKHPDVFDSVYVNLIAAGETSGTLDKSLERLANQQDKDADINSKIRGALIYPAIILLVLAAVVGFMVTAVLPQIETLYSNLPGVSLPTVTKVLLKLSHFLVKWWWLMILVGGALVVFFMRWSKTPGGASKVDRFKLNAPLIGPIFTKLYMARFTRTASTLVSSGVPLIQMLEVTADSVDNVHIEEVIHQSIEQVKGGAALSKTLVDAPHFPDLVPSMINIGEQSGSLGGMMEKLADYYERELDNQIKQISTIIEPALMIVVGIIALFVVAAVLLPIYSLAGKNLTRL